VKIQPFDLLRFNSSGHRGFVSTHGSINATCPEGVVRENVAWPKYVMRFPLVLSTTNLPLASHTHC